MGLELYRLCCNPLNHDIIGFSQKGSVYNEDHLLLGSILVSRPYPLKPEDALGKISDGGEDQCPQVRWKLRLQPCEGLEFRV